MNFLKTRLKWKLSAAIWMFTVILAQAHDLFQGYTNVRLGFQQMEVKFSMARYTVARLLFDDPNSTKPIPVFAVEKFNTVVEPLKRVGEKLFAVTTNGTALVATKVDVALNEEGDAVDFTVIYPRPAAGPLRIAAVYLKRLPDEGYGTTLAFFDEADHQIEYDDNLNMEKMFLDLKATPPKNLPPKQQAVITPQAVSPLPVTSNIISSTQPKIR